MIRVGRIHVSVRKRYLRQLASCDRRNYGDLLFPIVTRWAMNCIPEFCERYECANYGMRRSDLSAFGAIPSSGMSDLYRDAEDGDVVGNLANFSVAEA